MIGFLLLLASASAEPMLLLDWAKGPVRYHMETLIDTPRSMVHEGVDNQEARATRHLVTANMTCSGQAQKKNWVVDCRVDDIQFSAVAVPGEEAALSSIMSDYQQRMTGKSVVLEVKGDGRITGLDLKGVEKTDKRTGLIIETIRMMMRRVFAPMDLQLPKKGDAKGKPWKQKGAPLSLELMTRFGTAGGTRLEHTAQQDGPLLRVTSQGRGMVSSGQSLEAGTGAMMKIETSGRGVWDAARSLLSWREVQTSAKFSVSAFNASVGGADYTHKGWVAQIREDGSLTGPD